MDMRMFHFKFFMATPRRSSLSGLTMTSTTGTDARAGEWQCELEGGDGKLEGKGWLSW